MQKSSFGARRKASLRPGERTPVGKLQLNALPGLFETGEMTNEFLVVWSGHHGQHNSRSYDLYLGQPPKEVIVPGADFHVEPLRK